MPRCSPSNHGSRLALTGGDDGIARLWLIPLAPGEAGEPTPTEIISPELSPNRGPDAAP